MQELGEYVLDQIGKSRPTPAGSEADYCAGSINPDLCSYRSYVRLDPSMIGTINASDHPEHHFWKKAID